MFANVQFTGRSVCRRDAGAPLGLILIGATLGEPDEVAQLAFSAAAPADLPQTLQDARVERLTPRSHRIVSDSGEWVIEGAVHLHREVGKAFALALPPCAVPRRKRLFWWLALRLAATRIAQRLL
jgi:hypothetical protein